MAGGEIRGFCADTEQLVGLSEAGALGSQAPGLKDRPGAVPQILGCK